MLTLESALERILARIQPLPPETVPLLQADGRVLRSEAIARTDLPAFDNSAMDGYAVMAGDTTGASAESPKWLKLVGQIAAGEAAACSVSKATAVRIFTGSMMPDGADAVVMQEDTLTSPEHPGEIGITDGVKPWENVRFLGEDVKRGSPVVAVGTRLWAPQLAVLAASGIDKIGVSRQPVVGLLATGSELVEAGLSLYPGQIYESNRLMLASLLGKWGARAVIYPIVTDTLVATREALQKAFAECDAVVTSGGVSVGGFDFVKEAFISLGGKLDFWRVAIKPGKPFVFGEWNGRFLFGLPGNPVSAFVTAVVLMRPALLRIQGTESTTLPTVNATLAEPITNHGDRRHFLRVVLDASGNVTLAGTQASHQLHSLAAANALLDVPPETVLAVGSSVKVSLI
ncbi:MAG: molybdopterin molybdenumtransferase MoeA [Verrucomicrobia bacterium]|jgi:molybdopterin molybdotransferase|nr:molybdopterin molybdenumtransferase MoeA [Verrucomicrobiota bacterium]